MITISFTHTGIISEEKLNNLFELSLGQHDIFIEEKNNNEEFVITFKEQNIFLLRDRFISILNSFFIKYFNLKFYKLNEENYDDFKEIKLSLN